MTQDKKYRPKQKKEYTKEQREQNRAQSYRFRRVLGDITKYLDNTVMFVTLEPCLMCASAISEVHIAKLYSRKNKNMHKGTETCDGVNKGFPGGITNGAEWYVVEGGMQDFNYFVSNSIELTVEISCCKHIPKSQLSVEWHKVVLR